MVSTLTEDNLLLDLFTRYNNDLWPLHVLAYAMGGGGRCPAVRLPPRRIRWSRVRDR
jgi:hypothetical protein